MNWTELKPLYQEYLKRNHVALRTMEGYVSDINALVEFMDKFFSGKTPPEATYLMLEAYVDNMAWNKLAPTSIARGVCSIKSFYKFMLIEGYIDYSPTTLLKAPRINKQYPEILEDWECKMLINGVSPGDKFYERNKTIIRTLIETGIKVSELTKLLVANYIPQHNAIVVVKSNGDKRVIKLNESLSEEIKNIASHEKNFISPLFKNNRGDNLSRVMVFNIIRDAAKNAGITKAVNPEMIRNTLIAKKINEGKSIEKLMKYFGYDTVTSLLCFFK